MEDCGATMGAVCLCEGPEGRRSAGRSVGPSDTVDCVGEMLVMSIDTHGAPKIQNIVGLENT